MIKRIYEQNKAAVWLLFGCTGMVYALQVLHGTLGHALIHQIYSNRVIPVENYIEASNSILHSFLLALIFLCLFSCVFLTQPFRKAMAYYFGEKTHAFHLAIFRILAFGTLILLVHSKDPYWYSLLPKELWYIPFLTDWIHHLLPVEPHLVLGLLAAFYLAAFAAMVGFYTRYTAWLAVILSIYLLWVPTLLVKITHYHHTVWFALLVALSPCGDVWSLDAWLGKKKTGRWRRPRPSVKYALPIRMAWLLMGVLYFFPGFWKVFGRGLAWFSLDNLQLHLYAKWLDHGGWLPVMRPDAYPVLMYVFAIGTVVFEMGFIYAVLFRRMRIPLFFTGLFFHMMNLVFLRITFWYLQIF